MATGTEVLLTVPIGVGVGATGGVVTGQEAGAVMSICTVLGV